MIEVHLDHTSYENSLTIRKEIIDAYDSFLGKVLKRCGNSERPGKFPIRFENFKFNLKGPYFLSFVVVVFFAFSVSLTSLSMIEERSSGVWERFVLSDIDPRLFLISHIIQGLIVMMFQLVQFGVFSVVFIAPNVSIRAKFLTLSVLLSTGVTGVFIGSFASLFFRTVANSFQIISILLFSTQYFCGL
jgi:ABC-type multidrug transport system permease subunit